MVPTGCGTISRGGFVGIGVALLKVCVSVEVDFKEVVTKATQMCKKQLFMSLLIKMWNSHLLHQHDV